MIGTLIAVAFWIGLALLIRHEGAATRADCAEPMTITTAPDSVPVIYEERP